MSLRFIPIILASAGLFAATLTEHPTGPRMTPPTLAAVSPIGIARGATVEMTIEGLNLARASSIFFSEPGVIGRILGVKELPDLPDVRLGSNGTPSTVDVGPLPPRNLVTVELEVSPSAAVGPVAFRLQTPLGTTPEGRFLVEPYYGEAADREPDDTIDNAVETYLPAILTGAISKPGDIDLFKIEVKAGTELTFDNAAAQLGSTLQPVVTILDADQKTVGEYGAHGGLSGTMFAHRFEKAGVYYIRIADYDETGRGSNFYRIMVGKFPLASAAYPLGVERGKSREIALKGWNVPPTMKVAGKSTGEDENLAIVRPANAFDKVKLAIGDEPEFEGLAQSLDIKTAQAITTPATVNGAIAKPGQAHFYKFHARKDQKLVIEVNARRLGSELDSVLDVFDATGKPVERATVRSTYETSLTLSDRDSVSPGLRLLAWDGIQVGDYIMIGGEILRTQAMPNGPDEDMLIDAFGGQRIAYFDTTPEGHAVDQPIYKVSIHPPATKFTPNGLPVVLPLLPQRRWRPRLGKVSLIHFTAPADGDYIVRLADVRGAGGDNFAYRLTVRAPRPDFRLTVNPRNPNVPVGGAIPITVTALRLDEFDGPIDVELLDLPPGLRATKGVIASGQVTTTLLLSADAGAKLERAAALDVKGSAGAIAHWANPEDRLKLIALAPPPDILTTAETQIVEIRPGGKAEVAVRVQRQNGFRGRVPIEVRNLPPRVFVPDVGLNGVLVNEDEDRRTFTVYALPNAEPIEQSIYISRAHRDSLESAEFLRRSNRYTAPRKASGRACTSAGGPAGQRTVPFSGPSPSCDTVKVWGYNAAFQAGLLRRVRPEPGPARLPGPEIPSHSRSPAP